MYDDDEPAGAAVDDHAADADLDGDGLAGYADDDPFVVGEPDAAEAVWHEQQAPTSCAVVCQEFVLDQQTGIDHSEAELTAVALAHGWYDPRGGTAIEDVGNVLEVYGVPVEREYGAGMADISDALARGQQCIVGVDSAEIWAHDMPPETPLELYPGIPDQGADHAVEVIGIDYHDPGQPMVLLNDPGTPDGAGERVPLAVFADAWADSGNFLVVAGARHA